MLVIALQTEKTAKRQNEMHPKSIMLSECIFCVDLYVIYVLIRL